jgi:hypothetical protein
LIYLALPNVSVFINYSISETGFVSFFREQDKMGNYNSLSSLAELIPNLGQDQKSSGLVYIILSFYEC